MSLLKTPAEGGYHRSRKCEKFVKIYVNFYMNYNKNVKCFMYSSCMNKYEINFRVAIMAIKLYIKLIKIKWWVYIFCHEFYTLFVTKFSSNLLPLSPLNPVIVTLFKLLYRKKVTLIYHHKSGKFHPGLSWSYPNLIRYGLLSHLILISKLINIL